MADNQQHPQKNPWRHPYGTGCDTYSRWQRYDTVDWFPNGRMAGRARLRAARCVPCRTHRQIRFGGKVLVMTAAITSSATPAVSACRSWQRNIDLVVVIALTPRTCLR